MTKLIPLLIAAGLCSCASPQLAPRFEMPSTAPIEQAHKQLGKHLDSAKEHTRQIESECPQAKATITALSADLDGAKSELQTSEGARIQLDTQLKQQTDKANNLANSYDKQGIQVTGLKSSRHRYVMLFTYAALGNLVCLAWIFRKPLLLLVGL